ncbi:unnamed protein product [Durusdinium trenchii]|uniref:Endonuclease/exonuclease/phosphatase domain-containing protein n=1 Tax=Durusdinium trenchii TaxID=1381693 RepID=A0ABP0JIV3_9DINO
MDSKAAFAERAKAVGVSETHVAPLSGKQLDTFGAFAFISSFQPGGTDETPFVRALGAALQVNPTAFTEAELSSFRRLYYEAHTLAMGDLRSRLERKDGEAPRKIPMAERSQLLDLLKQELPGITIDLQLEPAHKLVDMVKQQVEDNCIRFLPLKECLMQDKIISGWFALLTKEPASGYRAVTLQQLVQADQELWLHAAQEVRGKNLLATPKPLDQALTQLQQSAEIRYHLLPLPASQKEPKDPPRKRLKQDSKGDKGGKKGLGKGSVSLPKDCVATTPAGARICFQYNRDRCNRQNADKTRRPTVRYLIPGQGQAFASGDATCACTASAIRGSVFVDAALTAKHPIDYAFPLPDALLEAVAKLISDGPKLTIARRKLALKKAKQQPLLEVLPDIPDLQTSWLLLLYCPSPRVHYALRGICPDLTKHFATERDNAVHTCLRRLLQQPNELPRPAIDTAAAHWASWQDPTPILRQKMPQVFDTIQQQIENPELPSLQCLQHVTAFLTSLGLDAPPCTQCQPAPPAPTSPHDHADTLRGWQRHASHITDTALKQEHIAHFTAPSQHLLESQCGPLAARIFTLFPVSHELVLDSSHFRLLLLQRLRLPCPSCQRAADVNSNDAPMAWNGEKFTAIEGPGVVWVARDKYGDRHVNWVRLQVVGSSETILFANTHGPLDQCGGKPGGTVATNYINAVNQHKKTKDVVIFTGDFNCGSNQDTIKQLSEAYQLDATDTSYNGADHIFSSSGFSVLWKGASDGSPSDHQLLKAVLQSGSHSRCPVPPDNGGCCLTCRFNHYCPSNKGCYASGQSGCSGGYCPAPPEVEIVV